MILHLVVLHFFGDDPLRDDVPLLSLRSTFVVSFHASSEAPLWGNVALCVDVPLSLYFPLS